VSSRVSPTEKVRDEIGALFTGDRDLGDVVEDVVGLGARLIIPTAVEGEVTEFLGRSRCQRSADASPVPGCATLLPDHDQDHHWPGDGTTPEAMRRHRGSPPTYSGRGDQDQTRWSR
jgi:hypothetical protein